MTDTQTPERIWAWLYMPTKQDEWQKGGWDDEADRKTTEYVRADLHAAVVEERDEADRRAGAAERELGWLKDESRSRGQWLSEAKKKAGYEDHISFDRVFEDLLAAKEKLTELEKRRA